MAQAEQKIVQYLNEAHASELGLVRDLQAQIAMTPRGHYRDALESHLGETREHATRIRDRLGDLGEATSPLQVVVGLAESTVSQMLALGKAPLALWRGSGGEEKVLKNAKEACASEALEIATYTAIKHLARAVGDDLTAELADSIRAEEERMLERVMAEIPKLTSTVVRADLHHEPSYEITETGAGDTVREIVESSKRTTRRVQGQTRRKARSARRVPGVAQAEGRVKGAVASEETLALGGYDKLTASEIIDRLSDVSQIELAKIDSYERRNQNRTTILSKISSLRVEEPWPGYDELSVAAIRAVLAEGNETQASEVHVYERSHKNRAGIMRATVLESSQA
jgi:ferritin-like metal-binding protein YciE